MSILSSLYSGVSGLNTNGNALSVIGNNIANSNTIGYKSGRSVFADLLSSTISGSGGASQIGRGAGMSSVDNIFTQGTFENTAKNTDLAIEGDGFFIIRDPGTNTDSYTRAGSFRWDAEGYLVSPEGYRVVGYSLNDAGNVSGDLTEIKVDTTTLSPPKATENVTFTTNLDAAAQYPAPIIGKFIGVGRTLPTSEPTVQWVEATTGTYDVGSRVYDGPAGDATDPNCAADPNGILKINGALLAVAGAGTYNQGSAKEIKAAIDSSAADPAVASTINPSSINLGKIIVADPPADWTITGLTINGVSFDTKVITGADQATYNNNLINTLNADLAAKGVEASVGADNTLIIRSLDGSNIEINSPADLSAKIESLSLGYEKTVFSALSIESAPLNIEVGTGEAFGLAFEQGIYGREAGYYPVGGGATDFTDPSGQLVINFDDPSGQLEIDEYALEVEGAGTYNQGSALEISKAIANVPGINAEGIVIPGSFSLGKVEDQHLTGWSIVDTELPETEGAPLPENPMPKLLINGVSLEGTISPTLDQASYDSAVEQHFNDKLNPVGVKAVIDPNTHVMTLTSIDGSNIEVINIGAEANLSEYIVGLNGNLKTTVFSGLEIQAKGTDIGELTINRGTDSTYGLVFNEGTNGRDAGFDIAVPEETSNYANSVTIYDSLGNPHQVTVYFSKLNPQTNPLEWEYNITVNAAELNLNPPQDGPYLISSGVLRFLEDGTLDPNFPSGLTSSPNDLSWNNNSDPSVQLNIDFNTTQWSNASVVISQDQDGYGTGTVAQLSLDNEGNILGNYSNGLPRSLYRIALAKFSNAAGLTKVGNNMFSASGSSGAAIVGTVGSGIGQIFTNSLEQSNVDLAAEFVAMITTQRGFQANSKIITTTDEMLNELINLKR
ncbi:flagellar hook-basal body complex protein [Trichloromonas sp.]|uniref:flagellar hook-basal body complex protein n=1 Tax=Trichloromonas sp. TaxID=3069249 RepID=UPI002A3A9797|nr:flagellar hook-basal body complex protein [Trichloromonas sp.]